MIGMNWLQPKSSSSQAQHFTQSNFAWLKKSAESVDGEGFQSIGAASNYRSEDKWRAASWPTSCIQALICVTPCKDTGEIKWPPRSKKENVEIMRRKTMAPIVRALLGQESWRNYKSQIFRLFMYTTGFSIIWTLLSFVYLYNFQISYMN